MFNEYQIIIGQNTYEAHFTLYSKNLFILDENGNELVKGELVTPVILNMLNIRKYKFDILNEQIDFHLWLAILTGILELDL